MRERPRAGLGIKYNMSHLVNIMVSHCMEIRYRHLGPYLPYHTPVYLTVGPSHKTNGRSNAETIYYSRNAEMVRHCTARPIDT